MKHPYLIGQVFGRLTVIEYMGGKRAWYKCKCSCGKELEVRADSLQRERTTSCGCFHKEVSRLTTYKHGLFHTNRRLLRCYHSMMFRCYNEKCPSYKDYGGRGVVVCDRWKESIHNFIEDMGNPPYDYMSLDRIDNNGNYEPPNCRWATRTEQSNNQRGLRMITYNNETMSVSQWARKTGIKVQTLFARLQRGISFENAIKEVA